MIERTYIPSEQAAKPSKPALSWRPLVQFIIRTMRSKTFVRAAITVATVSVLGIVGYWLYQNEPWSIDNNPFNATIQAGSTFPLYYPTVLPARYRISPHSASKPQAYAVIFRLAGPSGAKIFCSEEARSASFNLGGYYTSFSDYKAVAVSDGAVVYGKLQGNEVVSRANNSTWILCNTQAAVPSSQLIDMLKSITPAS
jgi:hypothetical protein